MGRLSDAYLGLRDAYPLVPGFKRAGASAAAARKVAGTAPPLRERVLAAIRAAGDIGLTPDEAAEKVGKFLLSVRPRVSELIHMGLIEETGEKRRNAVSGLSATVYRAKRLDVESFCESP